MLESARTCCHHTQTGLQKCQSGIPDTSYVVHGEVAWVVMEETVEVGAWRVEMAAAEVRVAVTWEEEG